MSGDLRRRLGRLDSCVLSDALDRIGLKGVAAGLARLSGDRPVFGPVLTMRLGPADGRPSERHLGTRAVEAAAPGDVILVEHHSRADCAGWGGILSCAAHHQGVAGVVVDGMCRDLDESRQLGFAVFARGAVPTTARGRVIEIAFGEPVTIGGIPAAPGDWFFGDGSGALLLPAGRVDEIVAIAEGLMAREAAMIAAVRAGLPVGQVMAGNYERMLEDGK